MQFFSYILTEKKNTTIISSELLTYDHTDYILCQEYYCVVFGLAIVYELKKLFVSQVLYYLYIYLVFYLFVSYFILKHTFSGMSLNGYEGRTKKRKKMSIANSNVSRSSLLHSF